MSPVPLQEGRATLVSPDPAGRWGDTPSPRPPPMGRRDGRPDAEQLQKGREERGLRTDKPGALLGRRRVTGAGRRPRRGHAEPAASAGPLGPAGSGPCSCTGLCCMWEPRRPGGPRPFWPQGLVPCPLPDCRTMPGKEPLCHQAPVSGHPLPRGRVHPPRSPVTYDTVLGDTHQWTLLRPLSSEAKRGGYTYRKEARGSRR